LPKRASGFGSLLTAVVTKTRSPQTTGLECESPGMGVFQTTPVDFVASHLTGAGRPSATPEALAPRNCGQFCAAAPAAARHRQKNESVSRFILNLDIGRYNVVRASAPLKPGARASLPA
jgi:hypothetical protein